MSKHTPGPWSFSYAPSRELFGVEAEAAHASDCEPWAYAEITIRETEFSLTFDDRPNDRRERALADAHLIAAAPEMLTALRVMVSDLEDYPASQRPVYAVDLARAAIAKAEGRK